MKRTYTSRTSKLAALLAGATMFGLVSQSALAAGTASGTSISNQASLTYSVGGVAQTGITSAAATFVVDNKVNVTVAEGNTAFTTVVPGQLAAVTTFTVTNAGNTTQDFALAGANVAAGQALFGLTDNFDATNVKVFVESGATAGFQPLQDTALFIDELAANGTATVYVVTDIPVAQVNNDAALVSLTATTEAGGVAGTQGALVAETTTADTAGVDVVWADALGTDDVARDGKHSARDAYKVVSAIISVAKTVTLLCDPFNGNTNPKNIPGAAVQYAITITNSGAADATLSQVTDTLNAALAFDTTLISGAGAGAACVSGTGSLSASGFGAVAGVGATTYAAPGLATQAVTAGATTAGQNVTINYGTLASPATAALVGGVLPAGDFVTVYFNAFVQ